MNNLAHINPHAAAAEGGGPVVVHGCLREWRMSWRVVLAMSLLPALFASGQQPITHVAEVRALPLSELAKGLPVRVRGIVTMSTGTAFTLQEGEEAAYVQVQVARVLKVWQGDEAVLARVRLGTVLEVEGVTNEGGFSPMILPRTLRILDQAELPVARPMEPVRFFSGAEDCLRITVRGVVQGARRGGESVWLVLDAEPGAFAAALPASMVPDLEGLVDAEVSLTGVVTAKFNARGEFLLPLIIVSEGAGLVLEEPARSAPFEAPKYSLKSIACFRTESLQAHRLRTEGTVTAVFPERIGSSVFIEDAETGVCVSVRDTVGVKVGDRVEVAGFVDTSRPIRGLRESVLRKLGSAAVQAVNGVTLDDIMKVNADAVEMGVMARRGDFDGRLVTIEARMVDRLGGTPGHSGLILASGPTTVEAIMRSDEHRAMADLQPGSSLAVTGIVRLLHDSESRSVGMELLLRSPDDIAVLERPSWWTRERVLYLLAGVATSLLGAGVWVWQLRRRVQAQSAQIAMAMAAHRNSELEMKGAREERFRLAADLHDGLQQHLTGATYRMEAALQGLPEVPDAVREQFAAARAALERTRTDLRQCLIGLRHVEEGAAEFPELLRHAAEQMEHWPEGAVEIRTEGTPFPLSRQVMGSLLMLMQEAVGNAFKHAAPTRVTVTLQFTPESLVMQIADDGSGFDPQHAPEASSEHFGIESLRHRMRWLGGTTEIISELGEGTQVIARLPRARAEKAEPHAGEHDESV